MIDYYMVIKTLTYIGAIQLTAKFDMMTFKHLNEMETDKIYTRTLHV